MLYPKRGSCSLNMAKVATATPCKSVNNQEALRGAEVKTSTHYPEPRPRQRVLWSKLHLWAQGTVLHEPQGSFYPFSSKLPSVPLAPRTCPPGPESSASSLPPREPFQVGRVEALGIKGHGGALAARHGVAHLG